MILPLRLESPTLPRQISATIRKPSYLSSKTQPGSSNGASVSVASIGCRRLGRVDARLISGQSLRARCEMHGRPSRIRERYEAASCSAGRRGVRDIDDRSGARIRPMARKLKTYQTSLGFFDQAIAAPSMKAALEAWGADSNLFHQGAARESEDPDVVAATMAKPGVVLKRPVGSTGPFREHSELPTKLGVGGKPKKVPRKPEGQKPKKDAGRLVDEVAERKAALAYERERKSREREQAKEEAARQKERERRQQAIDKAQA